MRLVRPMQVAVAGSLLAMVLAAAPALANSGPGSEPPVPPPAYAPPPYPDYPHEEMAPEVRASWLDECHARMGRRDRRENPDFCERYLDDYYARYRSPQPYGHYGSGYGYPGYSGGGCCQPMMMVPIMRMPRAAPRCKETVEYEYVDAPPRRVPPPRPAPDKRIKIVPDKRVPVK